MLWSPKYLALPLLFCACALPLSANAATAPAPAAQAQRTLSKAEYMSGVTGEFAKMDANKDNKLSAAEIEQYRTALRNTQLQARDRQIFAELDKDKNGSLSLQEFSHINGTLPPINAAPLVTKLDTNKDTSLTLQEYQAGAAADFAQLDANKDGQLSEAEVRAGRQAAMQGR